jgi:hypothetical protein
MKPAPFEYFAPTDLAEALALLDRFGDEAKVLAGGQSLMPLMNLRLARPRLLIDINRLPSLASLSPASDGRLVIGALTRQRAIERSSLVRERHPLLAAAMPQPGLHMVPPPVDRSVFDDDPAHHRVGTGATMGPRRQGKRLAHVSLIDGPLRIHGSPRLPIKKPEGQDLRVGTSRPPLLPSLRQRQPPCAMVGMKA